MNIESADHIVWLFRDPWRRDAALIELVLLGNAAVGPIVSFLLASGARKHYAQ
jgi:hypothetical protein